MGLTEHAIRLRTESRTSISQAADFVLDAGRSLDRSRMFEPEVSPYCFDIDDRTLWCVSTPNIAGATFLYQAQRQYARSVIKVPYDALPEAPASPTLIFSIGRCGSTLLHKAFEAAGVRTVSEPDYFRQAVLQRSRDHRLKDAVGSATGLLQCSVIKLHAECNNAALLVAGAFRAPVVMFILRDPVDWAASVRRVTRDGDPRRAANLLVVYARSFAPFPEPSGTVPIFAVLRAKWDCPPRMRRFWDRPHLRSRNDSRLDGRLRSFRRSVP